MLAKLYPLLMQSRIDYYDNKAHGSLSWKGPSYARKTIPYSYYISTDHPCRPPLAAATATLQSITPNRRWQENGPQSCNNVSLLRLGSSWGGSTHAFRMRHVQHPWKFKMIPSDRDFCLLSWRSKISIVLLLLKTLFYQVTKWAAQPCASLPYTKLSDTYSLS